MFKHLLVLASLGITFGALADDRAPVDPFCFLKVKDHNLQISRNGASWLKVVHGEKSKGKADDDQVYSADNPMAVYIPFMRDPSETATPHPSYVGGLITEGAYNPLTAAATMPLVHQKISENEFFGKFKTTLQLKKSKDYDEADFYVAVAARKTGAQDKEFTVFANATVQKGLSNYPSLPANVEFSDTQYEVTFDLEKLRAFDEWGNSGGGAYASNCFASGQAKCTYDLAFFLTKTNYSQTNDYDENHIGPSDITNLHYGGVFYRLNFSPKVYGNEEETSKDRPDIWDVRDGDKQSTLKYKNGPSISDVHSLIAVKPTAPPEPTEPPELTPPAYYSQHLGELEVFRKLLHKEIEPSEEEKFSPVEGSWDVQDLENEKKYYLAIMVVDKYQMASPLSNFVEAAPDEIVAFIQKQSCYLLSAGFGRRHFVIDYFKNWRDHFLQKFALGRWFIHWYYATAPHYTPYIYQHRPVQLVVQGLGYSAYFLIRFWPLWLLGLLGGGWLWWRRRRA